MMKSQEAVVYYICFDPYSLVEIRVEKDFENLRKDYPMSPVQLKATNIHSLLSEAGLDVDSFDLSQVIEYYSKKSDVPVHFLVDEVDGDMFTSKYAEKIKRCLKAKKLSQSIVVFTILSVEKERTLQEETNSNKIDRNKFDEEQTGMTLLPPLTLSMRAVKKIYDMKCITEDVVSNNKCILAISYGDGNNATGNSSNPANIKTERKSLKERFLNLFRRKLSTKKVENESDMSQYLEETNTIEISEESSTSDSSPASESNMLQLDNFAIFVPSLSKNSEGASRKICTEYKFHKSHCGINVEGDYNPTLVNLNKDFSLLSAKSALVVSKIFESLITQNRNSTLAIFCSSLDELRFVLFSLDKSDALKNKFIKFSPFIMLRVPTHEEKKDIYNEWNDTMFLVTDFRSFKGCEVEHGVIFLNPEDIHKGHSIVEALTRVIVNVTILLQQPSFQVNQTENEFLYPLIAGWKTEKHIEVKEVVVKETQNKILLSFGDIEEFFGT